MSKENPYCNFKDDGERRRALNVKAICSTLTVMVVVLAGPHSAGMEGGLRWLMHWLH